MKKLIFTLLIMATTFISLPNVHALDYTYPRKFAGHNAGDVFSISPNTAVSGDYYYGTDKSATNDYIVLTYCSVGPYFSSWVSNGSLNSDAIQIDTGLYCSAGGQGGTIKYSYYFVKYWTYSDSSDEAYIEGSSSSLKNNATYTSKYQLYGLEGASSFDVSYAILAYLKTQEEDIDYSSALSQIQQNTSKYNEEIKVVQDKLNETNTSINDMKDALTNSDVNDVESSFESFEGFLTENSTITQLITMPITLYTSILNGLQSTCQPFNLGNLFGTNLTIPCINIGSYLGTGLWTMIDVIISGFAIFAISKKLIKIFNNFSSMKEGDVIDD